MHKRQADMESQRRDCKHESEFGGGRAGTCPHCGVYIDVSGVATDVKLFHEAGCRLVHRYWIYRDPLPHVSLRGKVMSKLHAFFCEPDDGSGPIDSLTFVYSVIWDDNRTRATGMFSGCSASTQIS